jgi:hypothetical protein
MLPQVAVFTARQRTLLREQLLNLRASSHTSFSSKGLADWRVEARALGDELLQLERYVQVSMRSMGPIPHPLLILLLLFL